jgi:hypothetical protein
MARIVTSHHRNLRRATDPLFRRAGIDLDEGRSTKLATPSNLPLSLGALAKAGGGRSCY